MRKSFEMRILIFLYALLVFIKSINSADLSRFNGLKPVLVDYFKKAELPKLASNDDENSVNQLSHQKLDSMTKTDFTNILHELKVENADQIAEKFFKEISSRKKTGLNGIPKTVVDFPDDDNVRINDLEMQRVLGRKELLDRKIVVVSIVGAFRKGKSFLLDYFLRYLYFTYDSINLMNHQNRSQPVDEWIGKPDEPLKGFSWKGGVKRHTTGINMWSDVFLHDADNGEKFAIILIDTQGLFDHDSPEEVNARIFSFTTLMSSIQIYNLPNMIHENELQYLQFATEFAKFSMKDEGIGKPFDHLLFLMRDWENTEDYDYGFDDGLLYLNEEVLKIKKHQKENMKELRRFINDSFDKISCFLMSHPGEKIKNKKFDGSWSYLDQKFVEQLGELIPGLLSPENLAAKKINGKDVTVSEYLLNLEIVAKNFKSNKIAAQSVYESQVVLFMNQLVQKCTDFYRIELSKNIENITDFLELENNHLRNKQNSMDMFNSERKIGSDKHITFYRNLLITEIQKNYVELEKSATVTIKTKMLENEKRAAEDEAVKAKLEREKLERQLKNQEEKANEAKIIQQQQNKKLERLQKQMETQLFEYRLKQEELEKQIEKEQQGIMPILQKLAEIFLKPIIGLFTG